MKIYKKYICADGTEYIRLSEECCTVDEIIAFLEPHRGKKFYSGALEEPCLCVNDEWLQLEELNHFVFYCLPEDNQQLADDVHDFFYYEDEYMAYEEERLGDEENDGEAGDE